MTSITKIEDKIRWHQIQVQAIKMGSTEMFRASVRVKAASRQQAEHHAKRITLEARPRHQILITGHQEADQEAGLPNLHIRTIEDPASDRSKEPKDGSPSSGTPAPSVG